MSLPKQSTSFLVLQEILESEGEGNQLCVCGQKLWFEAWAGGSCC